MSPELIRYYKKKYPMHCNVMVGSLMAMYPGKVVSHLDDGSIKLEVITPSGVQIKIASFEEPENLDRANERFDV